MCWAQGWPSGTAQFLLLGLGRSENVGHLPVFSELSVSRVGDKIKEETCLASLLLPPHLPSVRL